MLNGFFGARQGTNLLPLEVLSTAYYDQHDLPYPFDARAATSPLGHGAMILDNTPYGQDVVYQVVNDAPDFSPSGDGANRIGFIGGYHTQPKYIKPDVSKRYRISVFLKTDLHGKNDLHNGFFLGTNVNSVTSADQYLRNSDTGVANGNPYVAYDLIANLPQNEWMLAYGYINPVGTVKPAEQFEGGIVSTSGELLRGPIGEFSFTNQTNVLMLRTFMYYGTRSGVEQRFYHPRIDICDGSEPTIQELLIRKFG